MKRLIISISTIVLSAISFSLAAAPGTSKSNQLERLNSAWNRQGVEANPAHLKQDTHIVYGGQDISRRPVEIATNLA